MEEFFRANRFCEDTFIALSKAIGLKDVSCPTYLLASEHDDITPATQAGVPEAEVTPRSKGEIALAELDQLRGEDVRFGTVLADAGYGTSAAFRHGLDARGLRWAVSIART